MSEERRTKLFWNLHWKPQTVSELKVALERIWGNFPLVQPIKQEAQLMLTNPHDAFRGQSRSPNMVPFNVRYGFLLPSLKSGSEVTQGHRNRHGSIRHLCLPINVTQQLWAYLVPFPR